MHCGSKNHTPATSWNIVNKYEQTSITFLSCGLQPSFNWLTRFDKTDYQQGRIYGVFHRLPEDGEKFYWVFFTHILLKKYENLWFCKKTRNPWAAPFSTIYVRQQMSLTSQSMCHGGRRHPGFLKFQILTVRHLKRFQLRRRATFGRNRSNCCRDMAIFRFF